MKISFKNYKIILILIIFLAAFLRIVALNKIPAAFHHDELLSIYEGYSIFTTGRDQWGNFLPLRFKAFGDYPPPLYFYFNALFAGILGLNEWAIRLPAAILGILTVWFVFLLTKELFKNKTIALWASFLMAISPWHLHYSRIGWPAIMVPFLIVLGLWLFFSGLNYQKNYRIYLAIIFISLACWTYTPAQLFVPLLFLGLFIFYQKKFEKRVIFYSLLIAFIFLFPLYLLSLVIHPEWQTRFNQISIFRLINYKKSSPLEISSNLKIKGLGGTIFLFFYNYLSHLSPYFLFIKGDANLRHSLLGMGQLYLFEMFILIFLIVYLIVTKKKITNFNFLLYWLFISPLPSSLTIEAIEAIPHATRTIVLLPVPHLLSALGIFFIFSSLNKEKIGFYFLSLTLSLIILFSFTIFAINYYLFYPQYSAGWFNYGEKELAKYLKENYKNYDKIIISTEKNIYLDFLFYLPLPPKKFHSLSVKKIDNSFIWIKSFDKFEFVFNLNEIKEKPFNPNTLYVIRPNEELPLMTKKIIYLPDHSIAYKVMALK